MPYRRLAIAAAILLAAVYLKLTLPVFREEVLPAVKNAVTAEQLRIDLPAGAAFWRVSD